MEKFTKIALVILYLVQIQIVFREQTTDLFHEAISLLGREPATVREVVYNTVLETAAPRAGPTGQMLEPMADALAHTPAAIGILVEVHHPLHDHDKKHSEKDRVQRHRRLHGFRSSNLWCDNLARSIQKRAPPAGTRLAFAPAVTRHIVFEGT
jgi:hypothetical protein